MLTLKDLKEYDIKDFDIVRALGFLRQRRDYLLNGVIIFVAVIATLKIINDRHIKTTNVERQISLLADKAGISKEYEKAKKELDGFLEKLPSSVPEADLVIKRVNTSAVNRNIQILSFAPAERETAEFYTKTYLRLSVSAADYKALGLFIRDIEKSDYPLRIDRCSISTSTGQKSKKPYPENMPSQTTGEGASRINAEITIAILNLTK